MSSSLKNLVRKMKGEGLDGVTFSLKPIPAELQWEDDEEMLFFQAAMKAPKRSRGVFSPSELSVENPICARKMYFQRALVEHDPGVIKFTDADNRIMQIVDMGTMIHTYIQMNLRRAGLLIAREVKVESAEHGIKGSCDGIIRFDGVDTNKRAFSGILPLEIKSINDNGWNQLKTAKPDHIKQASIYSHFLGYDKTLFLYYNKNNCHMKLYIVDNDKNFLDMFLELGKNIVDHYRSEVKRTRSREVTNHQLPGKICSSATCDRAINCPFRNTCFSL